MHKVSMALVVVMMTFAAGCATEVVVDEPGETESIGSTEQEARQKPARCHTTYVSRDTDECAAILFLCADPKQPFFNGSGCGCACPGSAELCDDPSRSYISTDPAECQLIRYACASGVGFSDDCGCGCIN